MSSKTARRRISAATVAALVLGALFVTRMSRGDVRMMIVERGMLCVTEGELGDAPGHRFSVDAPKMRAYVNRPTTQTIEAQFTYLGPTAKVSPLGSGEVREQFGLKLRAQDPCNLVYAMWRIQPESKLVVSVKTNPGQNTSAECGNRGYQNIKPARSRPVPTIRPGSKHSLRAEMDGENLRVFVDGNLVWQGAAGADALALNGPVGIRSDNARLDGVQLLGGEPSEAPSDAVLPCKSGPSEAE